MRAGLRPRLERKVRRARIPLQRIVGSGACASTFFFPVRQRILVRCFRSVHCETLSSSAHEWRIA